MGLGSWRAFALANAAVPASQVPVVKTQRTLAREREEAYWRAFRFAERALLSGPSATRPRGSTVRRMMRTLGAKGPSTQGARIKVGDAWVHPTKCRAAW